MTARRIPTADEHVTAVHEAGHACVAIDQSIRFTTVDIIPSERARGHIKYGTAECNKFWHLLQNGRHKEPRVIDLVHRKIVVSFAGAVAQRRFAPRSTWRWDMGHTGVGPRAPEWRARARDGTDLDNINEYLRRLMFGPPEYDLKDHEWDYLPHQRLDNKTLVALYPKFEARAVALVKELWPDIRRVAAALLKKKVLSYAEVRRLMAGAHQRGKIKS